MKKRKEVRVYVGMSGEIELTWSARNRKYQCLSELLDFYRLETAAELKDLAGVTIRRATLIIEA